MQIINVDLKRSHYGATVEEVRKAFNVGKGVSTLLGMAVDPEHRPTVEGYQDIVGWKLKHTEGEALEKWRTVASHLHVVLAGSQKAHDQRVKTAALQSAREHAA